jgi:hypothetical protein
VLDLRAVAALHCTMQIMSLTSQQLSKGLVTCSTGNHALAFVWACSVCPAAQQAPSTIYLPTNASPAKVHVLEAAADGDGGEATEGGVVPGAWQDVHVLHWGGGRGQHVQHPFLPVSGFKAGLT